MVTGSEPTVPVYDTSGPTDPKVQIDLTKGLKPLRKPWIEARQDSENSRNLARIIRVCSTVIYCMKACALTPKARLGVRKITQP